MHSEIQQVQPEVRDQLCRRDLDLARKNIYAGRRTLHRALPKNREEVHDVVQEMSPTTPDGDLLTLINDPARNIIVFGTHASLVYLCRRRKVYMDGTFSYSPQFFTQLFTIHGLENETYVPLLFCLLPDKTKETYEALFKLIINKCMEINEVFYPHNIIVDYELAIHQAIRASWIGVEIVGCRFHLTQNW